MRRSRSLAERKGEGVSSTYTSISWASLLRFFRHVQLRGHSEETHRTHWKDYACFLSWELLAILFNGIKTLRCPSFLLWPVTISKRFSIRGKRWVGRWKVCRVDQIGFTSLTSSIVLTKFGCVGGLNAAYRFKIGKRKYFQCFQVTLETLETSRMSSVPPE